MTSLARPHEHELEPEYGLPEPLPSGERLLWQGAPSFGAMALRVFHVRKVAVYFAALVALRMVLVAGESGIGQAARSGLWLVLLFGVALGMLLLLARWTVGTTVYTLTDKRVVMRIGIVLTVTYNLPLSRIEAAAVHGERDGTGDIALRLQPGDVIGYLHLWPHARPWRLRRPEPALRCLPDVQAVASRIAAAWTAAHPGLQVAAGTASPPAASRRGAPVPAGRPPAAGARADGAPLAAH